MNPLFLAELRRIAGSAAVLHEPLDLMTYECDALPHLRAVPAAVVLPASAAEVQAIVRLCAREQVPFVARGHGTGYSGGAHCLKYGFTTHHVLGLEAVMPDGEVVHIGGARVDTPGPDLIGLIVGSEGTLAIVTSIVVRILRRPEAVQTLLAAFDTIDAGGTAVSEIISSGIIPAAVEMMDALAIEAAEAAVHPGFPKSDTILIVELDGPAAEVGALFDLVLQICRRAGATTIEVAQNEEQRARIWRGRKAAFAAMGRVSPNYYVQDGVVPRTRLPEVLHRIRQLEARSG